jgi:hypothetical protein
MSPNAFSTVVVQLQLLLGALSAILPLSPPEHRARLAEVFELAGRVLSVGALGGETLNDLTTKLRRVRVDIERLVETGAPVTPEQLDAAMAKVRRASAAFRAAAAQA